MQLKVNAKGFYLLLFSIALRTISYPPHWSVRNFKLMVNFSSLSLIEISDIKNVLLIVTSSFGLMVIFMNWTCVAQWFEHLLWSHKSIKHELKPSEIPQRFLERKLNAQYWLIPGLQVIYNHTHPHKTFVKNLLWYLFLLVGIF